jgi:hypothetical protein
MIYQTFQEETRARGPRKIKIINIGLEPWEAQEMGLGVEDVDPEKRRKPIADYVLEYDEENGTDWEEWLQTHRTELNTMTTPQLIDWLDRKMADYEKLIPPADVLSAELDQRVEEKIREELTERILREAGLEDQIAAAVAAIKKPAAADLAKGIKKAFKQEREREWRDHVENVANKIIRAVR